MYNRSVDTVLVSIIKLEQALAHTLKFFWANLSIPGYLASRVTYNKMQNLNAWNQFSWSRYLQEVTLIPVQKKTQENSVKYYGQSSCN